MLIVKFPNGEYTTFSPTSGSKLGKGATADIYRFQHDSKNFAAKIYKNVKSQDREKIDAMIAMDSAENPAQGNIPFCSLTWPMARIENNAALVGFAMPILDHDEFIGFESFFDYNLRSKLPSSDFLSVSLLVDLAYRLAEILTQLHSNGIYVVDLKPQNIRISKKNLSVHILDCDGFSIKGKSKRYPAEHISADYISPETSLRRILPTDLGEGQDRYTFAVMVFQLLNRGIHPFQGVVIDSGIDAPTNDQKAELGLYAYGLTSNASIKPNPRSVHTSFPTSLRFLFDKAFTQSDLMRPSLKEWRDFFSSLAVLKKFKRCERFPLDVAHIHFGEGSCSECYSLALSSQSGWKSGFSSPQKQTTISQPSVEPKVNQPLAGVSKSKSPNFLWVFFALIFIVFVVIILGNREPVTSSVKPASSSSSQKEPSRIIEFDEREGGWSGDDYVVSITNSERKSVVFSSIWLEYKVEGCGDNIATKHEMILIQKSLAGEGYRVGVDGKFGPRTKAALTEFQKSLGLSPTGLVTRETANFLGVSISGYGNSRKADGLPVGGFGMTVNSMKRVRFVDLAQKLPDGGCFFRYSVKGSY